MKLVVGNQKSYLDENGINDFVANIDNINSKNVIICPSSIYFSKFKDKNILLGCQSVSNYNSGATTGELSAKQLKSIGVDFAIVGHSERRQMLNETIYDTNIKIKKLLENRMVPILCVGETKEERDSNKTKDIISEELKGAFIDLTGSSVKKVIIAYEPIWAIGTGVIPTNGEIIETVNYIREFLANNYTSSSIILYGGSVSSKNVSDLNKIDVIDGYLIGGASTRADEFLDIIDKCNK